MLLSTTTMISQHTERFLALTKNVTPIDTTNHHNFFTDGHLKECVTLLSYKTPSYTYQKKYDKSFTYYNDGKIKSEQKFDPFGNEIYANFYNPDGTTWWKSKVIEIDSNLENTTNFFTSNEHILITKWVREYERSKDTGKMFLKSEGEVSNGNKSVVWKTYNEFGRLKEEVTYK